MLHSARLRVSVQDPDYAKHSTRARSERPTGRFTAGNVSLRDSMKANIERHAMDVRPLVEDVECIDRWHIDALVDIFSSELATGMSNNVADYVSGHLLPYRYMVPTLPARPARSLVELKDYISSFSNTSNLLKHIVAVELKQHTERATHDRPLVLHTADGDRHVTTSEVVNTMLQRAEIRRNPNVSDDALEAIIDTSFTELLFALRQDERTRFSIAVSSDHCVALSNVMSKPNDTIRKINASARRLTAGGEVSPTWREYAALVVTLVSSTVFFALGITFNWAKRSNILERIFDGAGLFGLISGVCLAAFSRRLDFHDLVAIILRKKRFIERYSELLELLDVTERELKRAITFEGVHVPPLAADYISYAFEKHDGVFNTQSGLDTKGRDANIIVGNETALMRGSRGVWYFNVAKNDRVSFLTERDDAMYRIVTDGDDKIVR